MSALAAAMATLGVYNLFNYCSSGKFCSVALMATLVKEL
jgi:hypothetical protein